MGMQPQQMRPPTHPQHQQQFMQQPAAHYHGNPTGMMPQSQQNGATAQFNSPPTQHQWLQQHQQQIPHPAQPPSQRNPT
jgi:hypothetical protein